jgi:hypothetical protein
MRWTTVLLFLALSKLTGALYPSAFVAAVFAVHPLHVETVAWVSERKGALSGLFFALTLLAYARYVRRPSAVAYFGVLAGLVLALLIEADDGDAALRAAAARRVAAASAGLARTAGEAADVRAGRGVGRGDFRRPAHHRCDGLRRDALVSNAARECGGRPTATISRGPSTCAPGRLLSPPGRRARVSEVALSALALVGISAAALRLYRPHPHLLVGWLWFVGMLVPTLGLVQVGRQSHADRYMYLPLVGLAMMAAWGGQPGAQRAARRAAGAAACVLILALAIAGRQQLEHWRDGTALWERVLEVTPGDARAHTALGAIHARRLEFDLAERHYRRPSRAIPACEAATGRFEAAAATAERAADGARAAGGRGARPHDRVAPRAVPSRPALSRSELSANTRAVERRSPQERRNPCRRRSDPDRLGLL